MEFEKLVSPSLKDLFIGSEGTLGIITEVLLKLLPRPAARRTLLATYDRMEDAAEDVFSCVLTLRPAGAAGTLRAELDKEKAKPYTVGTEAYFAVAPAAVMLLSETE